MATRTRIRAYLALTALFIVVGTCLRLSWWQLERAEEKRLWLESQQQQAELAPANLATLLANEDPRHRRARLFGEIDNAHPVLLDNRTLNRVAGYHLLSPMLTDEGHWVLINRGWLPRGARRDVLPDVPAIAGRIQVDGIVYQSPGEAFVLKDEQLPDNQWPLRVQKVDFHAIGEKLGVKLAPFEIRVTPELSLGGNEPLPRHWQDITVMGPEQHKAYALQWLGLAIAALVIFLFAGTRAQKRRLTGKPE
ncbi:SURF1 family protein [Alcanivorax sp. S6407]|uniref:SURF1 family protein n=1 Tax=Alcanivorax sp. S6407 TaxID=2926424 RepID=UPI001FF6C8AD|nr:SURF1 family protein [Alcanivorax sp. S6407]MCK0153209.1 SURF1 family protein [Alcanivorax sp. S6407]